MGTLRHTASGRTNTLRVRHLVGRAPRCDLVIPDRRVSGEHAVIWWDLGWWVRDLGSSNGTFVRGKALEAGQAVRLGTDDPITFGDADDAWVLVQGEAPAPSAEGPDGERVVGRGELLGLPSGDDPRVCILRDGHGRWVAERPEGLVPVRHDEIIEVDGRSFRLHLPEALPGTLQQEKPRLDRLVLQFRVTADEEDVDLTVLGPAGRIELGARSHHYLLLTLARARLADVDEGVAASSCGWVYPDELAKQLGSDRRLVNVHVFRARQQLQDAGIPDSALVVERRGSSGQLRIGVDQLQIERV